MAISAATNSAATTPAPVVSAAGKAINKLANDFDNFLTLLTTQLQNQDPTNPMDSKEFTSQLVQFTSVEQSIQSNKNLEKLIALSSNSASGAAFNYIGREVRTSNPSTALSNGAASWSYEVDPKASSSAISVLDVKGNAVFTKEGEVGAGEHKFIWDGKDKNGTPFPEGVYTLSVSAVNQDKKPVGAKVFTVGTVTNVEISGESPSLFLGNVKVPLKDVLSVTQGNSSGAALDYIGRDIRTINPRTNLKNGAANWTYEVDPKAATSMITVKNSKGVVVLEQAGNTGMGTHSFVWNGKDKLGDQQPDGVYSISVKALDNNNAEVDTRVFTSGRVSSVDSSGAAPSLIIGDVKISMREVLTVTDPASIIATSTTGG